MTTTSVSALNLQETIENLLRATGREHIEDLLTIMRDNGYYNVGCHGHHRWQGGLAQHSLEVLLRMQRQADIDLPADSIVIVSLLHDLCTMRGFKQYRHHGSRSVLIATREAHIKLSAMEYQAILWHMHGIKERDHLGSAFEAVLDNPLWQLLRKADHYSTAHPMTKAEFQIAISGKPRIRRDSSLVVDTNHGCSTLKAVHKAEEDRTPLSDEGKRIRQIRRGTASLEDVLAALNDRNINRRDALELLINNDVQLNNSYIIDNLHFKGFSKEFLRKASYDEIQEHRAILMDRCQYDKCAAKYTAMYIYDEAAGVFDHKLHTNTMYDWLKAEFNINATLDSFHKARRLYDTDRR